MRRSATVLYYYCNIGCHFYHHICLISLIIIDGQVLFFQSVGKWITFFCFFVTKGPTTNICFLFETAACTCIQREIFIYLYMLPYQYLYMENGLTENGNFLLLAAIGKQKWQTSVCFLQTKNRSLIFPWLAMINDN